VMRRASDRTPGLRTRALIVLLWRVGLRINEALSLAAGSEAVSHDLELAGTRRASSWKSWFRRWTQLPRFRTRCVEARR
jgi:site-specific recombinase XerD